MGDTTLPLTFESFLGALAKENIHVAQRFHGDSPRRQPVHTFTGGAHRFKSDTVLKMGRIALRALRDNSPNPDTFADIIGYEHGLAEHIYTRVVDKLNREPIEDYRIDFEEGFGSRPDEEEDDVARAAAEEMAAAFATNALPLGIGIRIKPLSEEHKHRSLRTFDLFLTRLLSCTGDVLPSNFVITLPKITSLEQVAALVSACQAFEYHRGLPTGSLRIEVMIETTQSILTLPGLSEEGHGRLVVAHFGTFDYLAACGIVPSHQHILHPACEFAKHAIQVALAGTGIWLSDGATNVMPLGPHRESPDTLLTPTQREENRRVVHRAWRRQAEDVWHSHIGGFYQGWDLHPAQLPPRYAAVYAFFLEGLDVASEQLQTLVRRMTLSDNAFDADVATGQGLLNRFERAMNCGAIGETEAVEMTGLTLAELHSKSFVKIVANRRHS